jgi:DNA polymerase-4
VLVVPAGSEREFLDPLLVAAIPGVGPATETRLRKVGVTTVVQLRALSAMELEQLIGVARARWLLAAVDGRDGREVVTEREAAKSVSHETTFETDVVDPLRLRQEAEILSRRVAARLEKEGVSGRTVTVKVRFADFTTITRARTVSQATQDSAKITSVTHKILVDVDSDVGVGVRLLGVGVSSLTEWDQPALEVFEEPEPPAPIGAVEPPDNDRPRADRVPAGSPLVGEQWRPGQDVEHPTHGRGWVWGAGRRHVTVRFETIHNTPGTVRTFDRTDPQLKPATPVPWTPPPLG